MRALVWTDGEWGPGEYDVLGLADREGVYDTLQVTDGEPRRPDLHAARFAAGCGALGLPTDPGPPAPRDLEGTWTLRWLRWREGGGSRTLGVLTSGSLLPPGDPLLAVGMVRATTVPVPPDPSVKTLALFGRRAVMARLREQRGWDDFLVADSVGVLEGSHWALLARVGEEWVAPRIRRGLLDSTHVRRLVEAGEFEGRRVSVADLTVAAVTGSPDLRGVSASGVRRLRLAPDATALLQG